MANRLINETSPYLLQHAQNPVDWFPWGEEAFEKARSEDKPVLVSIGYAACHWCHVMERESFEDDTIAAKMNELIVAIKVDREERPEVDAIYMQALHALQGQGGWPLNVFLMPDGRPFFGGTYFPNVERGGMPSWPAVVDAIADAYHSRRESVIQNATAITHHLQTSTAAKTPDEPLRTQITDQACLALGSTFNAVHGGFGRAPKFPQSMPQEFLLRYHTRTGDAQALSMVETSLTKMAMGGIYDHLGGGFSRYSTDDRWLVPHFEKMLYDNALLAQVYLQAYQVTGDSTFRAVTEETLEYLLRDLRHTEGGFFSSQDADSEGVEGKYYVWTPDEIDEVLGSSDGAIVRDRFGVSADGNFDGSNILNLSSPLSGAERTVMRPLLDRLREARSQRVPPATDDKVLTSWNGLAIRALAEAGAVLDEPRYIEAARGTATFILEAMRPDGRLLRTWKDGNAHLLGYLEDYAFLINALVSLHQADFQHRWLHDARLLADEMLALFWDEEAEVLYDVGHDHEKLIVRPREYFDNAIPSGASAAAEALHRLGVLAGDQTYTATAGRLLRGVSPLMARAPLGLGNWLKVLELHQAEPAELAIVGSPQDDGTRGLLRTLHASYRPARILVGLIPGESMPFDSPLLEGRGQVGGRATAYVCSGYRCELPTTDAKVLADQLEDAKTA